MTTTKDQYDFWRRRLAGEDVPIHDGEYQAGFYRLKDRTGNSHPVAYWFAADGTIRCRIGNKDVNEQTAAERWMWASKQPITHELYKAVMAGEPWPDQSEAVTRSNNAPPDDSFEGLSVAIADLVQEAGRIIKAGEAKTQDEADRASDVASKLGELKQKAEAAYKLEKQPHEDKVIEVREKWRPTVTAADIYKEIKRLVVTPFLVAKDNAEKAAREAAAKAGQPEPEPQRSTTKAGTRGKTVALRTQKKVEITDRAKLLAYFADSDALTAWLQDMAERTVRAGVTPPGVNVTENKVAA